VLRWVYLVSIAVLLLVVAGPGVAQDLASSYHIGEHVQVKPTPWQDVWEEGVIRDFSYDHSQLIIRSPSADRAFNIEDVRHIGEGGPAASGAGQGDTASNSRNGPVRHTETSAPAQANLPAGGGRNGERVSVAVGGACCYDGTIIGTGAGAAAGMYLIHYDHPGSQDAYAQPRFIYPFGTRNPNAAPATARRGGPTRCVMTYLNGIPTCLPVAAPR
jgi:hypothetical protein